MVLNNSRSVLRLVCIFYLWMCPAFSLYAQTENEFSALTQQGKAYLQKKRYKEAEATFTKGLSLISPDTDEKEYAAILNGLAKVYTKKGYFTEADSLFQKALDIRKRVTGKNSPDYAESLNDYSRFLFDKEEYAQVEEYLKEAITIREKNRTNAPLDHAESLNNLGYYYLNTNKHTEAFKLLQEAEKIRITYAGEISVPYADSKFTIGNYFLFTNDFAKAQEEYRQMIEINRAVCGENHPDYAESLLVMSTLKSNTGAYEEAESLIRKGVAIITSYYDKAHPSYAAAMVNLGGVCFFTGKYEEAEVALKEALSVTQETVGKKNSYYVHSLNMLGQLYQKKGLHEQAEPLLIESLKLRKEIYGENHSSVANAMNTLSVFYLDMKNYEQAMYFCLHALLMTRETLGENSLDYGIRLINSAQILKLADWKKEAVQNCEKGVHILRKLIGENHPTYIMALAELGISKADYTGHNRETESILLEVKNKNQSMYGKNHPNYIMALNNLAVCYADQKQTEKASALYEEIRELTDKESKYYSTICSNIGYFFLYEKKDIQKATFYFLESIEALKNEIKKNFLFFSEQERASYWSVHWPAFFIFQSFAVRHYQGDPSLLNALYNSVLFSNSLLLNSSIERLNTMVEPEEKPLLELWTQIKAIKEHNSTYENKLVLEMGFNNRIELHDFLTNSNDSLFIEISGTIKKTADFINEKEKEIFSYRKDILKQKNELSLDWRNIQETLNENEIAIEFITFVNVAFEENPAGDIESYALLIRPGYTYPEIVFLGNHEKIETAINQQKTAGCSLTYSTIWEPIEPFLEGVEHIYTAPSGPLSNLSFAGLKKDDRYLIDDYTIHRLLSTKDIIQLKEESQNRRTPEQIVLFGGADFMNIPTGIDRDHSISTNLNREILEYMDSTRGPGFTYLPGSRREVMEIGKFLTGLNWKVSLYTDKNATETQFKSFSSAQSPDVIHISTHGFYFKQPEKETFSKDFLSDNFKPDIYRLSNDPLMRSGLIFAGANHVWKGNKPIKGIDDGILTAYEISHLNLFNTELVVLSACNTGLGDIDYSEGVYGLQRAFRLAGVETLIVSLWEVPDKETVELMTEFYRLWGEGMSKKIAFDEAQKKMRHTYPGHPEKWAAFMMIE